MTQDPISMIRWLQETLREAGMCIDGGACHHGCKKGAAASCFRQQCCVPLSGSGLTDDWKIPAAPVHAVEVHDLPAAAHKPAHGGYPSTPTARPLMLRGVAREPGDGWKDSTRIGDVVHVWNRERPEPYAPGQFPRVGNPIHTAAASQFRFKPVPEGEAIAVVDRMVEELRAERNWLRDTLNAAERRVDAALEWYGSALRSYCEGNAERKDVEGARNAVLAAIKGAS